MSRWTRVFHSLCLVACVSVLLDVSCREQWSPPLWIKTLSSLPENLPVKLPRILKSGNKRETRHLCCNFVVSIGLPSLDLVRRFSVVSFQNPALFTLKLARRFSLIDVSLARKGIVLLWREEKEKNGLLSDVQISLFLALYRRRAFEHSSMPLVPLSAGGNLWWHL